MLLIVANHVVLVWADHVLLTGARHHMGAGISMVRAILCIQETGRI